MNEAMAYSLQRVTGAMLAVLVFIHLAVILYAIEGGLSADEVLARTNSTVMWPIFYSAFVVTVSIHAPLGFRNIIREWFNLSQKTSAVFASGLAVILLLTGLRAVVAIS